MYFSETWFKSTDSLSITNIDGFSCERMDKNSDSNKMTGGGVCANINKRWCTDVHVRHKFCSVDIMLIAIGLRPFYLPREFNQIFVTVVYIQPRANVEIAFEKLADITHKLEQQSPDSVKIVLGDFNQCPLENALPSYHQYMYINNPTRGDRAVDKCYDNVKDGYTAHKKVGLRASNHDMNLVPKHKQKLKQRKPMIKKVKKWSECFDRTDWSVFLNTNSIDQATETISGCIKFCEGTIVPHKEIKCYPNIKP